MSETSDCPANSDLGSEADGNSPKNHFDDEGKLN